MGLTSAAVVSLLVLLQLALSTAGQAYQYSIGWTNGRKRAYEADKELQRLPLPFSAVREKDLEDDLVELNSALLLRPMEVQLPVVYKNTEKVSQDARFRKRLNQVLWKMDNPDEIPQNF